MGLQVLVAAVGENPATLAGRMNLESDAIIVNQTDRYAYQEYKYLCPNGAKKIQCYNLAERGVGLSRNHALLRATGDFLLFADEDIVYDSGYEQKVLEQFAQHPEADFLLFNIRVGETRATYYTERFHRVHLWNAGRGAYYFSSVVWWWCEVQQRRG